MNRTTGKRLFARQTGQVLETCLVSFSKIRVQNSRLAVLSGLADFRDLAVF
jgi:hypothetical protein